MVVVNTSSLHSFSTRVHQDTSRKWVTIGDRCKGTGDSGVQPDIDSTATPSTLEHLVVVLQWIYIWCQGNNESHSKLHHGGTRVAAGGVWLVAWLHPCYPVLWSSFKHCTSAVLFTSGQFLYHLSISFTSLDSCACLCECDCVVTRSFFHLFVCVPISPSVYVYKCPSSITLCVSLTCCYMFA